MGWWLQMAGERACATLTIVMLGAVVSIVSGSTICKLCRCADEERERARLVIPLTVGRFRLVERGLKWYVEGELVYIPFALDAHGVDGRARERDHNTDLTRKDTQRQILATLRCA